MKKGLKTTFTITFSNAGKACNSLKEYLFNKNARRENIVYVANMNIFEIDIYFEYPNKFVKNVITITDEMKEIITKILLS